MEGKLYSLLIGINDYRGQNLNQCVADVTKISDYIKSLADTKYKVQEPQILLDNKATKSAIVSHINLALNKLSDDDTFLIYFSGHGAQENSKGRFLDDHNGRMQCLVCYPQHNLHSALLADKELRYLFSKIESKAHIIGVYDCCHSGDITRNSLADIDRKRKRISQHFPARPNDHFLFHKEKSVDQFKNHLFKEIFECNNIIALSACASHESAWEDRNGGVFSRNLIQVLNSKNSFVNYNDLAKLIRLSIQSTTREKQTPTIDVSGNMHYNQMTSWLNLHGERFYNDVGKIHYNKVSGWLYSKGSIHGVKASNKVTVKISNNEAIEIEISTVKLDHSILDVSDSNMVVLGKNKSYSVLENLVLINPKIFINDIDNDGDAAKILREIVNDSSFVTLVDQQSLADFDINIFNQLVFVTFNNDPYRPICDFHSLLEQNFDMENLKAKVKEYFPILQKWFFYSQMELKDEFENVPLKIEFSDDHGNNWQDLLNGSQTIIPNFQRNRDNGNPELSGVLYKTVKFKLTNISSERLYVALISLSNGRLEIAEVTGDNKTVELDSGASKQFEIAIFLDHYMEVYNWEHECVNYRFIVTNHSDLNIEIPGILQKGLSTPRLLFGSKKGNMLLSAFKHKDRSAIYFSKIILRNPTCNQISGILKKDLQAYMENEEIGPFIQRLYFELNENSLNLQLIEKPNNGQVQEKGKFKMNFGNFIDYNLRKRKFKKLVKRFPKKPVIVAEGDSWFLYPILVKDTLDHLMETYPVKSLAWAGDTLEQYKKSGQLIKEVEKLKPKYVMISGGGNDIIGPEIKNILKSNVHSGSLPTAFLNDNFKIQMGNLENLYKYFFRELSKHDCVEKILVHGYDYIRTDHAAIVVKGGWVTKHLIDKGIINNNDQQKLMNYLIDEFNNMLSKVAEGYLKTQYVDIRNTIQSQEWYDEIHPNDDGYQKIAKKFMQHLN